MPTTSLVPFPRYSRDEITVFSHMFPRDAALWRRFIASDRSNQFIGFDYDVKIGQAAINAIAAPTPDNMLALGTLAKRIDALGFYKPDTVAIIEIKPGHASQAVGQLLVYKNLFTLTYPNFDVKSLILITDRIDPDLSPIVHSHGIQLVIV